MKEPLVGVQLGAHSVFDEGAEHCLDLLRETAGANAVFVYTHSYHISRRKPPQALTADHGVPVPEQGERELNRVWVEHHDEVFGGTFLRHPETEGEYAGRDVLAELAEPAEERGIALYGRILEPWNETLSRTIPNWSKILTVDVYGRINRQPCWNHPDYRNFWVSTVEDLFKTYPLRGLKFGSERVGPLSRLLYRGAVPVCFCEHCRARGRAKGIDVERARRGFRELYELIHSDDQSAGGDGMLINVLRSFLKYPEMLAWEYEWYRAREEAYGLLYGTVKVIDPEAEFGLHIDHQQSTWDTVYRAEAEFDEMADYCDFLKPIVYHDIAGPRIRRWVLDRLQGTVLGEISLEQSLELFYDVMGYDKEREPELDELDTVGFSPDYVYRVIRRFVEASKGKVPIYAGIGIDVPWNGEHFPTSPEGVYQATLKAFEAGASGIVISREYDEMRVPSLRAVKRAVEAFTANGE